MAGTDLKGGRPDILRGFRYNVSITPEGEKSIGTLGFSKVSGLNLGTSDVIEYREGNERVSPRKIPGLNKFDNITLEQGRALSDTGTALADWRAAVVWAEGGKGGFSPDGKRFGLQYFDYKNYRASMRIQLINRNGKPSVEWQIDKAWPISLKFSDLDGNTSDVLIQTLEIATEGIQEVVGYTRTSSEATSGSAITK